MVCVYVWVWVWVCVWWLNTDEVFSDFWNRFLPCITIRNSTNISLRVLSTRQPYSGLQNHSKVMNLMSSPLTERQGLCICSYMQILKRSINWVRSKDIEFPVFWNAKSISSGLWNWCIPELTAQFCSITIVFFLFNTIPPLCLENKCCPMINQLPSHPKEAFLFWKQQCSKKKNDELWLLVQVNGSYSL